MFKAEMYKTFVWHVLIYGSESWALRKDEQNLLERTEVRMSRWIMRMLR